MTKVKAKPETKPKSGGGAPVGNQNALKDGPTQEMAIILRATEEERNKIDEGAEANDVSRNAFVINAAMVKARRVLKNKTGNVVASKSPPKRDKQIPLRVIPDDQLMIDQAAALHGESRNSFMINAAFSAAKMATRKKK